MNAQQVYKYINAINPCRLSIKKGYLPENLSIVDEIYSQARKIKPCDGYRNGIDRELWIWTDRGSIDEFAEAFEDHFTVITNWETWEGVFKREKMEKGWPLYFPDEIVWFRLYLAEFNGQRGIFINRHRVVDTEEHIDIRQRIDMAPFLEWILEAEKRSIDMILEGTYNDYVEKNLPCMHRSGIVKMSTYWDYVSEDKKGLFGKIDAEELEQLESWDENEKYGWDQFTSNDYFRLCDSYYDIHGVKNRFPLKEGATPKDAYMAYADNYSSATGFLRLDGDSPKAFADYVLEDCGDHHVWAVLQIHPRTYLYPKMKDGKCYISLCFEKPYDYDLLVHYSIELKKMGFPILKPNHVLTRMAGEQLLGIDPVSGEFDWRYAKSIGVRADEHRVLPMEKRTDKDLLSKVQWFPTAKCYKADEE